MSLIGLISDVHASPELVEQALDIFDKAGVNSVLCAGDIAGYMDDLDQTIELLMDHNCKTIMGNHDLSYLAQHADAADNRSTNFLQSLPLFYKTTIEEISLYMVHAQPPDACHGGIKLLDKEGRVQLSMIEQWAVKLQIFNYDVLVVGHTHQVFAEIIAGTLVINPGSSAFNNSCAILRLPEMTVELFALSGKGIKKTWNWGEHMI